MKHPWMAHSSLHTSHAARCPIASAVCGHTCLIRMRLVNQDCPIGDEPFVRDACHSAHGTQMDAEPDSKLWRELPRNVSLAYQESFSTRREISSIARLPKNAVRAGADAARETSSIWPATNA
jgi:hypothetical protein